MRAVDHLLEPLLLCRDDRTLAVPLREIAEIGTYQRDTLQLFGGVVGIPCPVEAKKTGIPVECLRSRDAPRHGDTHRRGVHFGVENLGPAAQQGGDGPERRIGLRLELNHQLQRLVAVAEGPAAVAREERHDRLDVECLESHVGTEILHVVSDEQLPVVQEDVGLDRRDLLCIGLIEGHALRVVVVRMDQHGGLGRSRAAARQREGQQQMAEIRFHAKVNFNG